MVHFAKTNVNYENDIEISYGGNGFMRRCGLRPGF
jgi:hypothetical protein